MRALFVCRASTEIGLGHLMRSRALAEAAWPVHDVRLVIIGDRRVRKLVNNMPFPCDFVDMEGTFLSSFEDNPDVVVFDTIRMERDSFRHLKSRSHLTVSISPFFEHMAEVDLFFNRTKYVPDEYASFGAKQYSGLPYAIVQPSCARIETNRFRNNLMRDHFPVALSMGGGDAANKTLLFLNHLSKCDVPATFWVLLGEGYSHSYDALISAIERDENHEIILAKTNMSMWHILSNCVLAILPSGITTYEAACAGLPTINMFDTEDQFFLIRELVEAGVSLYAGLINEDNLGRLNELIKALYGRRHKLLEMHRRSSRMIDGRGSERIIRLIESELSRRRESRSA